MPLATLPRGGAAGGLRPVKRRLVLPWPALHASYIGLILYVGSLILGGSAILLTRKGDVPLTRSVKLKKQTRRTAPGGMSGAILLKSSTDAGFQWPKPPWRRSTLARSTKDSLAAGAVWERTI